jgi:hypothetical protein
MDAALDGAKIFMRATPGQISAEAYRLLPRKTREKELVSDIFVPQGETLSLGQMAPDQFDNWRNRPEHERFYHDLADWLNTRAA